MKLNTIMKQDKEATASNVVQFVGRGESQQFLVRGNAMQTVEENKIEFCDEVAEFAFEQCVNVIANFGALVNPERTDTRDIRMIESAIQSAIYRYYGMYHPLQDIIEEITEINDTDDDN